MSLRSSVYFRNKRVSKAHAVLLRAYEDKFDAVVQINQGRRTIAEQWGFYRHYKKFGRPLAAYPSPGAPHIKYGQAGHALDINAGSGRGQAQHVAGFYRSLNVPVAFNVSSEAWHMDTLSEGKLKTAARKLGGRRVLKLGSKGPSVVRLKKLLYNNGARNFSGAKSSNRANPIFNRYTKAAVIRFQKSNGLHPDGVVGDTTWRKLR